MRAPIVALAALLSAPGHAADGTCLTCARQAGEFHVGTFAVDFDDGLPPYSPWDEAGSAPIFGASAEWEEAARFRSLAFDYLSDDDYRFDAAAGALGGWRADVHYDRFAVRRGEDAVTPYRGIGSSRLTLPADWVPASTTDTMAGLPDALHDAEVGFERGHLALGLAVNSGAKWQYDIRFDQRTTEGVAAMGGVIGTNFGNAVSAILPVPVDHRTTSYELAAHYAAPRYHLRLAYEGSLFENANRSVTWENAFELPGALGEVPEGRLALAPDNQFHQMSLAGGYDISERSRTSFRVAYAQMRQDESLLPYTVNSALAAGALPADSADARIDSWNADLKWLYQLGQRDSIDLSFKHDELENLTPQEVWDYVIADAAVGGTSRVNLPYSFRRQRAAAAWLHRLEQGRVHGGVAYQREERAFREAADLREHSAWVEWVRPIGDTAQLLLHGMRNDRDGDYEQVTAITPQENPLLRKYTMAARIGNRLRARFDRWFNGWDLGVEGAYADYDYPDSTLGLTGSVERSLAADAAFRLTEATTFTAFLGAQHYRFTQAGSAVYAAPDWHVRGEDDVVSAGAGVHYKPRLSRWEAACDATATRSRGDYRAAGTDYPTLEGDLITVSADVGYRLSPRSHLRLKGVVEHYREQDWAADNVAPDTIGNVLSLGEGDHGYRAGAIGVGWYRQF